MVRIRHLHPLLGKNSKDYILFLFLDYTSIQNALIDRRIEVREDNTSMVGGDSIKLDFNTIKYVTQQEFKTNRKLKR